MNSAEKPFQSLTSSEKDVFKICSDIIAWYPKGNRGPELLKLRQRATELFEKMRRVNMAHDDSYYKYKAEANALKSSFEKLLVEERGNNVIEVSGDDIEESVKQILQFIESGKGVRVFFDWVPQDQEHTNTDFSCITVTPKGNANGVYELKVGELFDQHRFSSLEHIPLFLATLDADTRAKLSSKDRYHSEGAGEHEMWLTLPDISREHLEKLLIDFASIMKNNPRA